MSRFFKPYEGQRPFLFVSYAHKESEAVVNTIRILHDKGYRLWYDEGIPAGSDWPANIAQHMETCERVVFFLSARALESPNCYSEMRRALRLGKPILVVRLEKTKRDPRWDDILKDRQELPLTDSPAERAEAILRSGFLPGRFRHRWTEKISLRALGLAASLAFFLAAAGVLGALASGRLSPVPARERPPETPAPSAAVETPLPSFDMGEAEKYFAVSFPDSVQERAIRKRLNNQSEEVFRWQLAEIGELYLCGAVVTDGMEAIRFSSGGVCRINGAPVILGPVSDLSLIKSAVRLEKLALVCQPLDDLSGLSGHQLLRELSLAGSTVSDLSALQDLPSLQTLHLEHTGVRDLRALDAFPNLKTVTVSRDMLPLTWNEYAGFAVVLLQELPEGEIT